MLISITEMVLCWEQILNYRFYWSQLFLIKLSDWQRDCCRDRMKLLELEKPTKIRGQGKDIKIKAVQIRATDNLIKTLKSKGLSHNARARKKQRRVAFSRALAGKP